MMDSLKHYENKIMDPRYRPTWDEAVFAFYNYDYVNNRFDPSHEPSYDSSFGLFRDDIEQSAQQFDVLYRTLAFVMPFDLANYNSIKSQVISGLFKERFFTSASHSPEKAFEMAGYWIDAFQTYNLANDNNIVIIMLIIDGAKAKDVPFTDLEEVIMLPSFFNVEDISCSIEYLPLRHLLYKLEIVQLEALNK